MNSQQIKCFLESGKLLNFTKAAENLYLPQPAVSRYIAALEKELGTNLFIRENNRKIRLSDDGKIYYNMFRRFYQEYQITAEQLRSPKKILRFGYNIGWNISSFLPTVLSSLRQKNPELTVTIDCFGFQELLHALLNDKLDAILTLENYPEKHSSIDWERITSIKQIIIYAETLLPHGLAQSPSDFYNHEFFIVDDPRIQQLYEYIINSCKPYHFIPKLKTVSNMETVFASVENCLGVALLDEWGQNINFPGIQFVEMGSLHPVCLAWNTKSNTSAVQALKTELHHFFHSTPFPEISS